MPLPIPQKGQQKEKFISSCMGNNVMLSDYSDNAQRYAICNSIWKRRNTKAKESLETKDMALYVAKKIDTKDHVIFEASTFGDVTEQGIDSDNHIIKRTCLFGSAESKNNRIYQDRAIESLARLANGTKCYINHPTKTEFKERDGVRDLRDWVGVFVNPVKEGQKVFADLICREGFWDLVYDIATFQPKSIGNSINARVKVHSAPDGMESVVDVDSLRSVDLVASAATTTSLFESEQAGHDVSEEDLDKLLEIIEQKYAEEHPVRNVVAKIREGVISDRVDAEKIKNEIQDVTYTAFDMIRETLHKEDISIEDKKKKVNLIFDDLTGEVKKRMQKVKESKILTQENIVEDEEMELTLEKVKAEYPELVKALIDEFKSAAEFNKLKDELDSARVEIDKLTTELNVLKSGSEEIQTKTEAIEKERDELKAQLDERIAADKLIEKKTKVTEAIVEAKLPKEVVTDVFMEQLMNADSDEQITKLIADRKEVATKTQKTVVNSGQEFVGKVLEQKGDKKAVTDDDVKAFVSKAK